VNTNNRSSADGDRQKKIVLVVALSILALIAIYTWWSNRRIYPTSSSGEAEAIVKALYSACNFKKPELLENVAKRVTSASQKNEITNEERTALEGVIKQARDGSWTDAMKASLKFAKDQASR
jgi:hypothetical protein